MISNIALLGRPLLVKITFFVRSGVVLFIPLFCNIWGCILGRRMEWRFTTHRVFFSSIYSSLLVVLRSLRLHFRSNSELGSPICFLVGMA